MTAITPRSILMVGASGGRGQLYAAALMQRRDARIAGIVSRSGTHSIAGLSTPVYRSVEEALEARDFDVAIVSLPHGLHERCTRALIAAGVERIIKEKPLACSLDELNDYQQTLGESAARTLLTTTQRSVNPHFLAGREVLPDLGTVTRFHYEYTFAFEEPTSGWRAEPELARGGVLLDMGYHALKEIFAALGEPKAIDVSFGYAFPRSADHKLDDRAELTLHYEGFTGSLLLDRHAESKQEFFTVDAEHGSMRIERSAFTVFDDAGAVRRHQNKAPSKSEETATLLDFALGDDVDRLCEAYALDVLTTTWISRLYERLQ